MVEKAEEKVHGVADEERDVEEIEGGADLEDEESQLKKTSEKVKELDFLNDIPLMVSVELGRLSVTIKDLLQMTPGTVLEMEKLAGEPLEILVNKREVAKGEVVVINEKFGIRLTDIIDPFSIAKS